MYLDKLKILAKKKFFKNVSILVLGIGVAQLINLAATPILTRLYTPNSFGMLAFLLSISNPISIIISGRYDLTIVLGEDKKEERNLVQLAYLITVTLSVTISFISLLYFLFYPKSNELTFFDQVIFFIPLLAFIQGIFQTNNFWLQKQQKFKHIAFNKIMQGLTIAIFSIGFGFLNLKIGLCSGYVLGWLLIAGLSLYQFHLLGFKLLPLSSKNELRAVALKYREYPIYNTLPALVGGLTVSVPILIITSKFTAQDLGYFGLTRLVVSVPIMLLGAAISQVFFQRSALKKQENLSIYPDFKQLFIILSTIAACMILVLTILGPTIFSYIFGEKWVTSGILLRYMSISLVVQFITLPFSNLLPIFNKIKIASIWQTLYFVSMSILFFFPFDNLISFVKINSIIEAFIYTIYLIIIFIHLKKYEAEIQIPKIIK